MKTLKIAIAVLLGLALVVRFVLLTAREVPEKARFALDLGALREAAGPIEGCPASAHAEQVARAAIPAPGAIAGGPFSMLTFGMYSWQLRYDDGTQVVLDPVHSRETQDKQSKGEPYDDAAWARQEKAVAAASAIAVTHEHYDHLGGAADSAHFASLGARLKLTAAQRQPPRFGAVGRDLSGEATLESGPEGSLHEVAPCVVAITAAGHTPGSQMLYVRMKGGAELLLVGDIAWQEANLERLSTRARVISWVMGEDAEAVTHQLRAIADFKKANPSVDVVVAHDVPAMERRFQSGAVGRGFAGSAAKAGGAAEAEPKLALGVPADDKLGTAPAGLGLEVGAKAPDVTLDDAAGGKKSIAKLASAGPLYVVFYRGGWCPFCNLQMRELARAKEGFTSRGVSLVAISVDVPTQQAQTQAKNDAAFPFLSDPDLVAHKAFNVVHATGPDEQKALAGYGIDLASYSGKDHKSFAVPAVFLLDRKGVVRFVHIEEDYKTRPSPAQLLGVVDRMKGKL